MLKLISALIEIISHVKKHVKISLLFIVRGRTKLIILCKLIKVDDMIIYNILESDF